MIAKFQHFTLFLIALSMMVLAIIAFEATIESRDFSHLNAFVLFVFNVFLVGLIVGSLLLPFLFRYKNVALKTTVLISLCYAVIFMFDLAHIFPQPTASKTKFLFWSEVCGLFLAVPTLMLSIELSNSYRQSLDTELTSSAFFYLVVGVIILSIIICLGGWLAMA